MSNKRHTNIYDGSATKDFCTKLDIFHNESCNGLAMWGYAKHGTDLESIPMHVNNRIITDMLSKRLVGLFLNEMPSLVVALKLDDDIKCPDNNIYSMFMMFYAYYGKIYLVQVVPHYPDHNRFMFEVYPLEGDLTIPHINLFWVL